LIHFYKRVIGRFRLHHEYPLDLDRRVPLCRDRGHPATVGPFHLHQNVEQGLQVQVPKGTGEPTHLLLLRLGCDINSLLPGCHQGDAEVQLRGAAAEDRWHEPPGHPDADAHEAVQGPEELLHCWICPLPLPGDQETRWAHLSKCRTSGGITTEK